MLRNVKDYHYPGSLDEALSLDNRESRSFFIAGGTALALSDSSRPVELIDVSRLGLNDLELDRENGNLKIGASTRIQRVVESGAARSVLGGFLSESLEEIGSYPIRNAGTLGGSLVRPFPWSDIIPILSVLETEVFYYHEGNEKTRELSRLYESDFRSTLNSSIIEGVSISLPEEGNTAAKFMKFSRSEFDVASLNLACRLTVEGGYISKAKLSIGARPMTGERIPALEDNLVGKKLTEELAKKSGKEAGESAELRGDEKLGQEYREQLVKKMTEEAITEIMKEVANES
ncbi:MAG: FAD binding domain-containing protein [Candidatus Bipolaricaulota bacterium]|nr:FAD binding domain-containing protein [Candidatus Bipolaricaulota bacterium]MBS3791845.1 FAD binding domain-containing protein [Candidatus Bipolaricaulota bacterium]